MDNLWWYIGGAAVSVLVAVGFGACARVGATDIKMDTEFL